MLRLFRWFLIGIFTLAGVLHLVRPEQFLFLFPPFIPSQYFLIIATGWLEEVLALGLIFRRTRRGSAYFSAGYLLILNTIHFYVAWEGIPMFGTDSPLILWGRFFLQFFLIFGSVQIGRRDI